MDTEGMYVIDWSRRLVQFDIDKLKLSISKFLRVSRENDLVDLNVIYRVIENSFEILYSKATDGYISMGELEETVEKCFMCCGLYKTAKLYIENSLLNKLKRKGVIETIPETCNYINP